VTILVLARGCMIKIEKGVGKNNKKAKTKKINSEMD